MRTDEIRLTVLEPDDGMVLTNGETYSTRVYLGVGDSVENWREVPEEEEALESEETTGGEYYGD